MLCLVETRSSRQQWKPWEPNSKAAKSSCCVQSHHPLHPTSVSCSLPYMPPHVLLSHFGCWLFCCCLWILLLLLHLSHLPGDQKSECSLHLLLYHLCLRGCLKTSQIVYVSIDQSCFWSFWLVMTAEWDCRCLGRSQHLMGFQGLAGNRFLGASMLAAQDTQQLLH